MDDYTEDIDKYLKGQLTPAQMNALEKKALDDPFLADALQGIGTLEAGQLHSDIQDLQGKLARKMHSGTATWVWTARIAAGLLILAVSTFLIFFISNRQEQANGNLALNKEERSEDKQQVQPLAPAIADSAGPGRSALPEASEQKTEERSEPAPAARPSDIRSRAQQPAEDAPAKDSRTESDQFDREVTDEVEAVDSKIAEALREKEKTASSVRPQSVPSEITLEEETKVESPQKNDDAVAKRKAISGARAAEGSGANHSVTRKIVRGKVTFSEDGTGLPGVNVLVKGSNEGTVSDSQGYFQIAVEGQPTLQFSFIGFTTEEVEASSDELNVKLDTDVSELSEVVVVGGTDDVGFLPSTPTIMELAAPEGGRRMFKQYLEQNLQYPQAALENHIEGKVTVQFNIDMTGQLSNFRVIRGIGFGCEEEVIRLIRQGPKWSPTKKNEAAIKDRVRIRMRFSLPKK
jgi:TonB family protein